MKPAVRRFNKKYLAAANAVARVELDQSDRERVAAALTDALDGQPDFDADLFRALASDPLVTCAGPTLEDFGEPCPDGIEIRVSMHWSKNPDGSGRSRNWSATKPVVRCVRCGATAHLGLERSAA